MARLSRRNRKRLVSEINVVPYIDVMLVLLVIFMVTAPMLTPGVPIELPEASTDPLPVDTDEEPLVVSMNGTGELFINIGGNGETPVTLGVVKDRVMKVLEHLRYHANSNGILLIIRYIRVQVLFKLVSAKI